MNKEKLKQYVIALISGSLTGGIALDVLRLPVAVATGAAAGVSAAVFLHARRYWNKS